MTSLITSWPGSICRAGCRGREISRAVDRPRAGRRSDWPFAADTVGSYCEAIVAAVGLHEGEKFAVVREPEIRVQGLARNAAIVVRRPDEQISAGRDRCRGKLPFR